MKKLLLGTLVLLAFNAAVIITQMSCKKEAKADSPIVRPTTVLYITYGKNADNTSTAEIWICKLDGSNKTKLNITLPANTRIGDEASLTLDGRTVVFDTYDVVSTNPYKAKDGGIYTCSVDGGTAKKIVDGNTQDNYYNTLQGAY
jgi:hypothetical protein